LLLVPLLYSNTSVDNECRFRLLTFCLTGCVYSNLLLILLAICVLTGQIKRAGQGKDRSEQDPSPQQRRLRTSVLPDCGRRCGDGVGGRSAGVGGGGRAVLRGGRGVADRSQDAEHVGQRLRRHGRGHGGARAARGRRAVQPPPPLRPRRRRPPPRPHRPGIGPASIR
jgi:hypothetical protein